jgi:multidrug efflux pump subunit AcrB
MSLGANGMQTQNNGRLFITLKPRDQRDGSADEVIRRLRPQLAKSRRRRTVSAGGAGHQYRRAPDADAVSIYFARRQSRRAEPTSYHVVMEVLPEMQRCSARTERSTASM